MAIAHYCPVMEDLEDKWWLPKKFREAVRKSNDARFELQCLASRNAELLQVAKRELSELRAKVCDLKHEKEQIKTTINKLFDA